MPNKSSLTPMSIENVTDRLIITDLIYRYCRAMDRIDKPLGYSLWHPDGLAHYGDLFKGTGHDFVDWVCEQHSKMLIHSHQITNVIIELNGDKAGSESYVTAFLRLKQDDVLTQITVCGRYIDSWSRRDGHWGIDKRTYVQDFDEVKTIEAMHAEGWGSRDHHDPSYQVLGVAKGNR